MKITWYKEAALSRASPMSCTLPFDNAAWVVVEHEACPWCSAVPVRIRTRDRSIEGHDKYVGHEVVCVDCGLQVSGVLVVRMDTVFGLEEDERVTQGRCRVY